ncbi:hypothetical protein AAON49_09935 [Pseudotenacibaculum sp. MALMAid0570]|uniref:hypothetical protein n=1 Tax=Pseudotenacibaculum sp. MALMAid0570 TaxID=3143938 RepID=UPI0032DED64E
MKKIILAFAFLSFVSCNIDNTDDFQTHLIAIDEAVTPSSLTFGTTVQITVKYTLPNGCYRFYELFYNPQGNTRTVAVRALQDLNAVCTQATIEEEYTFPLTVTQTQDYVFRFWKGTDNDGQDIFEEVIIPVN